MRNTAFGRALLLGAALLLFGAGTVYGADARKPNLLVIVADDFGHGDIGVHGCKDIPTPHIDSLARNGVRCSNGYVSAPQCAPTRCGLLTGRYQQRFGYEYNADLADRLKAAGYATGLVGKWHLGTEDKYHPLNRGFGEFFGFIGGANPEKNTLIFFISDNGGPEEVNHSSNAPLRGVKGEVLEAADPSQTKDLAAQQPQKAEALEGTWKQWDAKLAKPAWPRDEPGRKAGENKRRGG